MPECYTHIQTATGALGRSGHTVASSSAFRAGATGFAPFYLYQLWKARPRPNLPALATRMRHEKTGGFLQTLVAYAATPTQQSYALGFLASYATDCIVNPYIAAMSATGAPYGMPDGKHILTAALDAELYYRDYKTRSIELHAAAPVLITEELAQVTCLLRQAIRQVYGKNVPLAALADAFHANYSVRRMLLSPAGRVALKITNPTTHSAFGPLKYRRQPGQPLLPLPLAWTDPFSGEKWEMTYPQLLTLAEQSGAVCITAAMRYWLGLLEETDLAEAFRNCDYDTGMPCAASPT